jgi:Lrp/AsnC family leucine-responsive transcriptional regulator
VGFRLYSKPLQLKEFRSQTLFSIVFMSKSLNNKALDDLNWNILKELSENARISSAEIGRRVGLSAPAVAERIQKLEEHGYIKGYNTNIDYDKIGLTIQAFVNFKSAKLNHKEKVKMIEDFPEVVEWHSVTGNTSMILKVVTSNSRQLEEVIERLMEFGETTTSLILSARTDLKFFRNVVKSKKQN